MTTAYLKLWTDINRELWRSACDNTLPRSFIRAELWRRVDHARVLEKSASVRMVRRKTPVSAVYRTCVWLVQSGPINPAPLQMPQQSALDPQNAAIPAQWPAVYPGVDISEQNKPCEQNEMHDHYDIFVHAFIYASQAAEAAGLDPHKLDLQFILNQHLWACRGTADNPCQTLRINFLYVSAPPLIWNAIFTAIVKSHAPSRRIAEQYAQSSDAQALQAVYADMSPVRAHDVYDLTAIFDSLNARFFNSAIPRPILAWTTRAQYRTLGTYDFHWNIIRITRVLNDRRIPLFVVEFVLYHEMLHIRHGAHRTNNRLISHTEAFRADERRFPRCDEAEKIGANLKAYLKNGHL